MKSLRYTYESNTATSSDTFADLMFCALIVLVLFVLSLSVEVSQRVRGSSNPQIAQQFSATIDKLNKLNIDLMEESKQLRGAYESLHRDYDDLAATNTLLADKAEAIARDALVQAQNAEVQNRDLKKMQLSKTASQRVYGSRAIAYIAVAYDHDHDRFYFVSTSRVEELMVGDLNLSAFEKLLLDQQRIDSLVESLKQQRGYSLQEFSKIFLTFSNYLAVMMDSTIAEQSIGVQFASTLEEEITSSTITHEQRKAHLESINKLLKSRRLTGEGMLPRALLRFDNQRRVVSLGDVMMTASEAVDVFRSVGGRGAEIVFDDNIEIPDWIKDEVLIPSGYIDGLSIPKEQITRLSRDE